jgi:hypothetical protein
MTAHQNLVALALRLGMGKVTQEHLAAFAREVGAQQAEEIERLRARLAVVAREVDRWAHGNDCSATDEDEDESKCDCGVALLRATLAPTLEEDPGRAFLERYRELLAENERLARHHAERCGERNAAQAEAARLRSLLDTTHGEASALLQRAENAELRLDEATRWIAVVTEELVAAGGARGDRDVALANLRALIVSSQQHAKELVKARNEGLERAAVLDSPPRAIWTVQEVAEVIRAMKEAEQ